MPYIGLSPVTREGDDFRIDNFAAGADFTAGSSTQLTLSSSPATENAILVSMDGVTQHHNTFSLAGTTLTFSEAIPTGVSNIEVQYYIKTTLNTISSGAINANTMFADSVITNHAIDSNAVTTAKIADSNVTTAKIANGTITAAKLAANAVETAKINDDAVTAAKLDATAVSGHTAGTVAAGDSFAFTDVDDSGNLKTDTVQGILDLIPASTWSFGGDVNVNTGSSVQLVSGLSGVTEVLIVLEGVSPSTDSYFYLQLGDSGGLETTGYSSGAHAGSGTAAGSGGSLTTGLRFTAGTSQHSATTTDTGYIYLQLIDSGTNEWLMEATVIDSSGTDGGRGHSASGIKALSAELTQINILTSAGSFDAGTAKVASK